MFCINPVPQRLAVLAKVLEEEGILIQEEALEHRWREYLQSLLLLRQRQHRQIFF